MADLFIPRTWVDGEEVNAVNFANRLENGIQSLDLELDRQTDRIDALYATGGTGNVQMPSGPSASRPSPAIGRLYLDTDLVPPRAILGQGTSWTEVDGTALPGGGASAAPKNMRVTVQEGGTIGAIVLEWDAVVGADTYTLYELQSPGGVAGATELTATTSTQTPSESRNYEYWVTATTAGVESAASNRVQATLPFGGGPTTSDPSTFLNINGLGSGTGGWWNLGIGYEDGHTDISPSDLQDDFVDAPYYVMNEARTAVQMQVFMNGGRTSENTSYPRCEFREYEEGSTSQKAAWDGSSGHHILRGKTRVMHYAPEKCEAVVAQMHNGDDNTLQITAEADSPTGSQTWVLDVFDDVVDDLISGVSLGEEVSWEVDLDDGDLTIRMNGSTAYTATPGYGDDQYFKVGVYPQQNSRDQDNPSSEYCRVELRDLFASHS